MGLFLDIDIDGASVGSIGMDEVYRVPCHQDNTSYPFSCDRIN